ncbi:SHOCT domain-containing protein [Crossiella sp. CA-258035]|uniref:SHOCT domain-containing protein n=1 Tax=Crossiella sp. CA-258035 TaxID=2981138 RepID=UPI0024BBEBB6|nr:SHOCT domain-containing protein [Crossiella sp. CA-258035]WHT19597.1 SHOCT domain-containing protein [Crossiella sp. CA-258035]
MTWHDELRKLDEGLAAGLISAEEYRARRDELLSAAAGAGGSPSFTPPGGQQQGIDSTQVMQPIRDNTPNPAGAEATQVVPNGGAEATQVVRGWQPQPPAGDADRTQVVPNAGGPQGFPPPPQHQQHQQPFPASPPSGFPPPPFPPQHHQQPPQQQPQTPWGDESNAAPPWGNAGDLPPLPPAGNEAWIRQGPEVFGASSGKSSKVLPIIGIVVVVALIGAAVWFFGFRNTGTGPADTTSNTASAAPTTTTSQKPLELLPPGPGTPDPKSGVKDLGQLRSDELLQNGEVAVIGSANPGEISYKGSTEGKFQYSAIVIETKDEAAAKDLQKKMVEFARSDGMVDGVVGELPKNGTILQFIDDARALFRIVWVSGNKVVRTNVSQNPVPPQGPNRDSELVREFHRLTVGVAAKFPGQ